MSVRAESDSQSDCTGRGSSLASRDDIQEIAASLTISNPELVYIDSFRVDRKRLEVLLFENENPEAATEFFDNIMSETNTRIVWPSRLKLGAKSRKDPHIKVMGLVEDVGIARKKIAAVLDMRSCRVTMKIDVSYTDHSHIIGKGGESIKKVMEETKCHIHFPDSNRNNANEKSNQVSITGSLSGVERARYSVRKLTPLIFCFDLPLMGAMMGSPDPNDPFIKNLQERYNVQVMCRSRQKLDSTLIVVKGCEWEVNQVKEATQILINQTCDSLASQVKVHMMLEISPHHQSIVLGKNNENIKGIMQRTSTQIIFVDPNDPDIPKLKKSNVTITGTIDNVYLARQQLIGSLPVVLIFDVPENSVLVSCDKMDEIMSNLDVFIMTKNKFKQNFISFIIKGIERNVANLYEARRQVLGLADESVKVEIPQSYLIPNAGSSFRTSFYNIPFIVSSPLIHGHNGNAFEFPWPNISQRQPVCHPSPLAHSPSNVSVATNSHQPVQHHNFLPWIQHQRQQPVQSQVPPMALAAPTQDLGHLSHSSLSLPDMPVYSSLSSTTSNLSSPTTSSRAASPVHQTMPDKYKQKLVGSDGQLNSPTSDWRAPGIERKFNGTDFLQFKIKAVQASQKCVSPSEVRVPTSVWSGYGFSQSSPYSALKSMKICHEDQFTQCDSEQDWSNNNSVEPWQDEASSTGPLASSNYLESISSSVRPDVNSDDLRTLLTTSGLEKYISLFVNNEIDLATFRTLTEQDFKDIGISAFGARRKLAFCIAELNRQENAIFKSSNGMSRPNREAPPGFQNW